MFRADRLFVGQTLDSGGVTNQTASFYWKRLNGRQRGGASSPQENICFLVDALHLPGFASPLKCILKTTKRKSQQINQRGLRLTVSLVDLKPLLEMCKHLCSHQSQDSQFILTGEQPRRKLTQTGEGEETSVRKQA